MGQICTVRAMSTFFKLNNKALHVKSQGKNVGCRVINLKQKDLCCT